MKINKYHGNYNISKRTGPIKYIVVHYVGAGSSSDGNAKNNCIYFSGGNRNASAHYFIDDGGIWEYADPSEYYTWHCGDGSGKYGITNSNSIGIEVCINGDNPFTQKEIGYLTELVQSLMAQYGVSSSNVVRHYDASRKMCPYYYAKRGDEWNKLHAKITSGDSMGWKKDNKGWWYRRADGSYPANGWAFIDNQWYLFDQEGYAKTGWQKDDNDWYYLNKDPKDGTECAMHVGWYQDSDNKYYYLDPDNGGRMVASDIKKINGKYYKFAKDGSMVVGTIKTNDDGSIIM